MIVLLGLTAGCGERLVDGAYAGDATVRIHGTAQLGSTPPRARVAALWLGYGAAFSPLQGIQTTVLPVSSVDFPSSFTFDLLMAPPSTGHYATHDGRIVPAIVRFARFVLFDDLDSDDALALDASGAVAPPDRLLARAEQHMLLFVAQPATDPTALNGTDALLTNWEEAGPGYHIVELDGAIAPPDFGGRVIAPGTFVVFSSAEKSVL